MQCNAPDAVALLGRRETGVDRWGSVGTIIYYIRVASVLKGRGVALLINSPRFMWPTNAVLQPLKSPSIFNGGGSLRTARARRGHSARHSGCTANTASFKYSGAYATLQHIAPGLKTEGRGDLQRTGASGLMDAAKRTCLDAPCAPPLLEPTAKPPTTQTPPHAPAKSCPYTTQSCT